MIVATVAAYSNVESRVEDLISEEELLNIKTPEDVHNKIVEMMQNDNEELHKIETPEEAHNKIVEMMQNDKDNTDFLTSRRDALIQELNEIDDALSLDDKTAAAATAASKLADAAKALSNTAKLTVYNNVTAAASIKACDLMNGTAKKTCYDGLKTGAEA